MKARIAEVDAHRETGTAQPVPVMRLFGEFASGRTGRRFDSYHDLHRWSVEKPDAFWRAVWDFDGIVSPDTPPDRVLIGKAMPGATWFPGCRVNYAAQILRHVDAAEAAGHPAIVAEDELGPIAQMGWRDLRDRVAAIALALKELGITRGDRVVAYLPNRPEAIVAFLACASIGAIWAICSPDMGIPAILERFRQIDPKLFIATDGVTYGGKPLDRSGAVAEIRAALPSLDHFILVPSGLGSQDFPGAIDFYSLLAAEGRDLDGFEPEWLPFDHPLWIVYSSGTTGKPKALVHGHGGILMMSAAGRIHSDLGASYDPRTPGERFHWFSSTGWMMWNLQVGGLLGGTTICIFDGSPTGSRDAPDWGLLWRFAARNKVSFFGAGAQYYTLAVKAGVDLTKAGDLSAVRALGSTASPLPALVQTNLSHMIAQAGAARVWWFNSSGGTDICGAFCTGNRELPEAPGKLQCRQLGAAVEAWDEEGRALLGEVGELVCTRPLPSMPLFLWGDTDGSRYRESYFDAYDGIWRHGDWLRIEASGACEIFGRSDATINRGGHRMGTSEIYDAVERLGDVADTLVIDARTNDSDSELLLFVLPAPGAVRGLALTAKIRDAIRTGLSPRFLPDRIIEVAAIPRTLSSKKQELPIKRLFEGADLDKVIDPSAMANPESLEEYAALAAEFRERAAA
ncbi:acetoacetate--CoA ligase [Sphingopyxis chilensis]|uniref:acetoacetate--CoA ligase n=1 Tax=Sphingopyxis chilensis TaxID=180400 RepID=UPI002DDCE445|nr:acetoacetate--CoA ligase [Sphingopyxis chilensis]